MVRFEHDMARGDAFPSPLQAVVLAIALGVSFLVGGPQRVASPTYDTIRNYGGELWWGIGFLAVAAVLMVGYRNRPPRLFWGYVAAASGYATFAVAVWSAALHNPTASGTAIPVYAWLAWVHATAAAEVGDNNLARAYRRMRGHGHGRHGK